jgi:Zn-dependent peptidase ImmA (M78 family)
VDKKTMIQRLKRHPDYPFADGHLESTILEIDRFVADPPLATAERGEVLEFVRLTHQYAFLERLIQGEILFDLPVHWELVDPSAMSPEHMAEEFAATERGLLGLSIVTAEELQSSLDERGIKAFRRTHGPEVRDHFTGAFQYEGSAGPALLVGAPAGAIETAFIFAHEYAHLVMDVNPYRSRFCRWRRTDLVNSSTSMEESRADRFALALLMPREMLAPVIIDLRLNDCTGAERDDVFQRAGELFSVPSVLVWRRMLDLSLASDPGLASPAAAVAVGAPELSEVDELRPTDLPERFVNLALAAYGRGMAEKADLMRFLRLSPRDLVRFLRWSRIPREPKPLRLGAEGEEPEPGTRPAHGD